MKVEFKLDREHPWQEIEVKRGTSIEKLCRAHEGERSLPAIAVRRNGKIEDLTQRIQRRCKVELLDIRDQAAKLIYQHSLIQVYLKAVEDVLGRTDVEVQNSLSKGLYTEIKGEKPITAAQVRKIESRMKQIIKEDLPFEEIEVTRAEGLKLLRERDLPEKIRLLEQSPEIHHLKLYSLDGFVNFFYGLMVPSTGYLYSFSLRKYMKGVMLMHPFKGSPDKAAEFHDDRKLYRAFEEAKRWNAMQDVHYVLDLNEKIKKGETRDIILLSEALHQKKIVQIAEDIIAKNRRLVLIAGPSSSGKTTFARRLCIQLQVEGARPLVMGTDDYFVERKDTPLDAEGEPDYENLNAVDVELFNTQMNDLLVGKQVDLPTFDFMKGRKEYGKRITSITPEQPIVIEGIHALNDALTPLIQEEEKYRIYISPLSPLNIDRHNRIPFTDTRMLRRMVRDHRYRGHSAEETILTWPKVRAGEDRNVFPYNGKADVFFNSFHVYELGLLKKYAEPLLREIDKGSAAYSEADRMLQFLQFFDVIQEDRLVSNDSILREFIGGSIFVE